MTITATSTHYRLIGLRAFVAVQSLPGIPPIIPELTDSAIATQSKNYENDSLYVDIEGLRDRIAKVYADNPLWEKHSMSQKLRQLIEERLNSAEKRQKSG